MGLKQQTSLKSNNYIKNSLYRIPAIVGIIISQPGCSKEMMMLLSYMLIKLCPIYPL